MSPPSVKQDNFYVNDLFNTQELAPIATTLLVALGDEFRHVYRYHYAAG